MSGSSSVNWQEEFGISRRTHPNFFSGKDDLSKSVPQAHVLRHAFEQLGLDGVLCTANTPLVYFKQVDEINSDGVEALHRAFWNHGGAPVLVLISKDQVHVYSGMSRPVSQDATTESQPALVDTLDRISSGLREFLVSIESGEYFQKHAVSFDPKQRVDRDLLDNLRDAREFLEENTGRDIEETILDALLCRLVFTCYLFDRDVIGKKYLRDHGIDVGEHLRDILSIHPVRDAKGALYKLFENLGKDFNGDLFSDDLKAEAKQITNKHIQILNDFFHGTNPRTRQGTFWAYDFAFIPIETISAIYEHFLKDEHKEKGAFYTPRFLAEVVLDSALEGLDSLIGRKFFDPACGSGIFLVGLFNRIAEEWNRANPNARNDRRAKELMQLMQDSLFGMDINPTACRITAFSLYLAFLDQLAPRDIQELQKKGRALPRLVIQKIDEVTSSNGNIWCGDFFEETDFFTLLKGTFEDADVVVGNPPWASIADDETLAGRWCAKHQKPLPDIQIATAFIWKASEHICSGGRVCFVLPHGTLVNHGPRAIEFQKAWITQHTIKRVLNLADVRNFLFEKAIHPAFVVTYNNSKPKPASDKIEYWCPKAEWSITKAEIISVPQIDRKSIPVSALMKELDGQDGSQSWVQNFWGSPRDLRFLDRLSLYPRLREHVRQPRERDSNKPWLLAEGFQPFGANDDEESRKTLTLPSNKFVQAKSPSIDLFLLPEDCETLPSSNVEVRRRITDTSIFCAPHILITKGFKRIAFADFDVCFRHALRGLHGPKKDRNLLVFLTAYLRSRLAKYIAFHTSPNRSMFHEEVHVNELLRLPFPFPEQQPDKKRSQEIVDGVAAIVDRATKAAGQSFLGRSNVIDDATAKIERLIEEYFEVQRLEKVLIEDTLNILVPSIQPSHSKMPVPTVQYSSVGHQEEYKNCVCSMLNKWAKNSPYLVRGRTQSSHSLGLGLAVFEKVESKISDESFAPDEENLIQALDRLRKAIPQRFRSIDPVRGVMVFDRNRLFVVKPIGQRYWSQTAALNDADEIAGTILMHSSVEKA